VTISYQVQAVKQAAELLAACRDAGCNFFDNAEVYAKGEAEILIGKAIKVRACASRLELGSVIITSTTTAAAGSRGALLPFQQPTEPAHHRRHHHPPQELGWKRSDVVLSTKLFWGGEGPNDVGLSRKHIIEGTKVRVGGAAGGGWVAVA